MATKRIRVSVNSLAAIAAEPVPEFALVNFGVNDATHMHDG